MIHRSERRLLFRSEFSLPSRPFLGLHTILATLIAFLFRFNKVAVYSGTFINNPFLTLVPIIIASYAIGAFILGRPLRIPAAGVELLRHPHLLTGDYYRQAFPGKLGHRLAFHDRRDDAFGGLFAYCLSSNILAVAGPAAFAGGEIIALKGWRGIGRAGVGHL